MGKSKLIADICLIAVNVLLIIDMIVAIILKRCVRGTDNALYISAISYTVFSVLQLLVFLFSKGLDKYIALLGLLLFKIFTMVFSEIVFDIAIKHTSDYVRNTSDLVVIIFFFVLIAIMFLTEIAYYAINLISRRKKKDEGENSSV